MPRFYQATWYIPLDYQRDTWNDLISTGKISLFDDIELRRSLSGHYNGLERFSVMDSELNDQLFQFDGAIGEILDPWRRLKGLEYPSILTTYRQNSLTGNHLSIPPPSISDVQAIVSALQRDPALYAELGQARIILVTAA